MCYSKCIETLNICIHTRCRSKEIFGRLGEIRDAIVISYMYIYTFYITIPKYVFSKDNKQRERERSLAKISVPSLCTLHSTHDELFTFRGSQCAIPTTNNCLSHIIG